MKYWLSIVALAMSLSLGAAAYANSDKPYIELTAEDLKALQDEDSKVVVIDARTKEEFEKAHIRGAVNLPADKTDKDSLTAIEPNKEAKIVFYCGNVNCSASANAAHKASEAGYTKLYKYPGGIQEWQEKNLPVAMGG